MLEFLIITAVVTIIVIMSVYFGYRIGEAVRTQTPIEFPIIPEIIENVKPKQADDEVKSFYD